MGDMIKRVSASRIELFLDQRQRSVQTVRIETSPDLAVWTMMESVRNKSSVTGGLGVGRNNRVYEGESFRGKIFHRFDPAAFTLTYPFYVRFVDVAAGVDIATSASFLAFDAVYQANYQAVDIGGTAPNGATIADSARIILPGTSEIVLTNLSGVDLLFASSQTGPERTLAAGATWALEARYNQLLLRGNGATAAFILTFSQQF